MSRRLARQTGFTLIELLVALSIIGVLVGLLMPAVQSARVSARQVVCRNQLRQLGLGLHMYHDAHACFPAGSYEMGPSFTIQTGWGWGAMILPHIEQPAVYEQIDFGQGTAVGSNLALIAAPIALWRCPADVGLERLSVVPASYPQYDLASGNYCGSEGILKAMSSIRFGQIKDGTSKTFLVGERQVKPSVNGSLPFTASWCGVVAFQNGYDSASTPHLSASRFYPLNSGATLSFGSRHTGGANFTMADGSVIFVNDSIDYRVYEALGTIAGGEVVSLP